MELSYRVKELVTALQVVQDQVLRYDLEKELVNLVLNKKK